MKNSNQMDLCQTIRNRKSCRAYLNQKVNQQTIEEILEVARWAPSGVNHQPTKVAVLGDKTKCDLSRKLIEKHASGIKPNPDYSYCPKEWSNTYKSRRKKMWSSIIRSIVYSHR